MKRKFHWLSLLTVLALMVSLLAACSSGGGSNAGSGTSDGGTGSTGGTDVEYPQMTLVLSAPSGETMENGIADKMLADRITEYSNGAITFDEYFDGTLCAPAAQLETIGAGVADVGEIITMHTASDLPLAQIAFCTPFASPDPAFQTELFNKIVEAHPEFLEEFEKMGVHPLFFKSTQSYNLLSKNPVTSIEDLNGMKVFGGGIYFTPWFESAGAAFVSGSIADVYQSLRTNVVQASWNFASNWDQYRHYEVAKYLNRVNMGACVCHCIGINLDTWNSFDDKTKALFERAAAEVSAEYNQWLSDNTSAWEQDLFDNGVEEIEFPQEVKEAWIAKIFDGHDTIQMWIDNVTALGYDGKTIMEDYLSIAESMGHEWAFDTSKY